MTDAPAMTEIEALRRELDELRAELAGLRELQERADRNAAAVRIVGEAASRAAKLVRGEDDGS